jgi:putative DNA primase/helicase
MTDLSVDASDTTEGFFSRWIVVPFTAFFPAGVADTTLIGRLTRHTELQGLLRMAVGGLQQVLRRGSFSLPESVRKATEQYRTEADPVRAFIGERIESRVNYPQPRTEVYEAYCDWVASNGFHQMSAQKFYEQFIMACVDQYAHIVRHVRLSTGRLIEVIRLRQSID